MGKRIAGFACVAAGVISAGASADFVRLVTIIEPLGPSPAGPRDVYRVYAEFTNPTDRVDAWYGAASHPMIIQNVLVDAVTLGSGFTNFGGSSGTLPPIVLGGPRDWDTWATIGMAFMDEVKPNYLNITPAFPIFISGNNLATIDASVFLSNINAPQGRADFRVDGNDTEVRVLIMQLVVNVAEHVRGTINLDGQIGAPGNYASFTALGQTFNSVPAPGGLASIAGLLLTYSRRRTGSSRGTDWSGEIES